MPIAQTFAPRNRVPQNLIGIGLNNSVDNASFQNIWSLGGAMPWATTWDLGPSSDITIVSDSVIDNGAGAGAQMVRVTGLDGTSGLEKNVIVVMNGTTPVAVPGNFSFIDSCQTLVAGVARANFGNIVVLRAGVPVMPMPAGCNLSQAMFSTVPGFHDGFIYRFTITTTGSVEVQVRIWSPQLQIWFEAQTIHMASDGDIPFTFQEGTRPGTLLTAGMRIEFRVKSTQPGLPIAVSGQSVVNIYHT